MQCFWSFHSVNIMYYYYQLLFLFLVSGYAIDDVARFLHDQGLDHLSPNFLAEEIEVCQIPSMPDPFLLELGVRTMGARLRIRSAANQWLQVLLLFLHLRFYNI